MSSMALLPINSGYFHSNAPDGESLGELDLETEYPQTLAVDATSDTLAIGWLNDARTLSLTHDGVFDAQPGFINLTGRRAVFTPDGSMLAAALFDKGEIGILDLKVDPGNQPAHLRPLREQGTPVPAFPTLHEEPPAPTRASAVPPRPDAPAPVPQPPVAATSSLLADLAGEAQRIRAHNVQMQRGERAARTEAEQTLSGRLLLVRDYFTQLAGQLNVIKPQVARDYPLLGLGVLRGLTWQASDVNTRNRGPEAPDQLARVSLAYLMRGQALMRCERDPQAANALRLALREHGLRFEEQSARDEQNRLRAQVFDVAPEVRGRVELNADYTNLTLRLTLQNVERFGLVDYRPPADDAGTEWLDELARLMLGQPSRFATLAKLIVPTPQ